MEIDLREVQALHARYAREHVIIDLEGQVRALPAPLLLTHEPAAGASPVRRVWNARWRLGRGALMAIGGAAMCAALGMGASRLWPMVHGEHAQAPAPKGQQTRSPTRADGAAEASAPALTSRDLLTDSGRANWSAAVDPSALLRQAPQTREPAINNPKESPRVTDEQKALSSPPRQHVTQQEQPAASTPVAIKPAPVTAPAAAVAPAASTDDQPAARPFVRHVARAHASPTHTEQPTVAEAAKPTAAPTPRNGDVQLF
ncbi:hypothetical protein P5W99_36245 [Paraburkholderia sp. A3BS-1L]|uniref:hypothetical protein n=1 Tax=Paraburkholderia sp. A3BS-1L TaxID=3028375 RepID=UPI003DAA07D7